MGGDYSSVCTCAKRQVWSFTFSSHVFSQEHRDAKPKAAQRPSVVRIYTNMDLRRFVLPASQYHYCERCHRHVAMSNEHCAACDLCPSKDGRAYIHCGFCRTCVKPGRQHCTKCQRCQVSPNLFPTVAHFKDILKAGTLTLLCNTIYSPRCTHANLLKTMSNTSQRNARAMCAVPWSINGAAARNF